MNAFETLKNGVDIADYARDMGTELKSSGLRLVGRCKIPGHDDRTPSFTIYPESQSWYCFGCCRGGDVIDLCQAIEGGEPGEALMALAIRYGIELPLRSEKWHRWQKEKLAIEDLAENVRFQVHCRRMFKLMILSSPEIQGIEDPTEKREEIRRCWGAFQEGMREVSR